MVFDASLNGIFISFQTRRNVTIMVVLSLLSAQAQINPPREVPALGHSYHLFEFTLSGS